jgi:RNA polymerase sigma factor (TIGR02999 family)
MPALKKPPGGEGPEPAGAAREPEPEITDLLEAWGEGDVDALDEVVALLYSELRQICRQAMARERSDNTLEASELVSELYVRLRRLNKTTWSNRGAFLGFAARVVRHVLVEYARARAAQKRGGDRQRVELSSDALRLEPKRGIDVLALEEALEKLKTIQPRCAQVVELRVYGGLTEIETARFLGVARPTVQRDWAFARRWLYLELFGERDETTARGRR